jgi:hypothetical protein
MLKRRWIRMSQKFRPEAVAENGPLVRGLSEPESYIEHQAALDATIFRPDGDVSELVLELEAGELRLRTRA